MRFPHLLLRVLEGKSTRKPELRAPYDENLYAHIEIVVAFLVVKNFVFLVIARYHTIRISRKLEEIFLSASRSFLNQNFLDQTEGKPKFKKKTETNPEKKIRKSMGYPSKFILKTLKSSKKRFTNKIFHHFFPL